MPLQFVLTALSAWGVSFIFTVDLAAQAPGGRRSTQCEPAAGSRLDSGCKRARVYACFQHHSESSRYWISGQANSIFQMHGHFHSPYEGPNSLIDDFEAKASEVATLYLGYQLRPNSRYNTDLIVDFENAGGRGISQALGLAGETNLDVVRNPNLSTAPYLARGEIHLTIGLTDEMTNQERGPFALATQSAGAPV